MRTTRPWTAILSRWERWIWLLGWYPYKVPRGNTRIQFACFVRAMKTLHELWAISEEHLLALSCIAKTAQARGDNPFLELTTVDYLLEQGLISEQDGLLHAEPCLASVSNSMVGGIDDCFISDPPQHLMAT